MIGFVLLTLLLLILGGALQLVAAITFRKKDIGVWSAIFTPFWKATECLDAPGPVLHAVGEVLFITGMIFYLIWKLATR